jgi:16S rRNA (guanine966-N2)-methyltransferase
MLRITAGSAKNKQLLTPEIEGYRAVQEIAKMAVFSIIGDKLEGRLCLDLYAGSGNMGIEALSRGAAHCTFVDENPEAILVIEKNLFNCNFFENFDLERKNALKFVTATDKVFDYIFIDPFYADQSNRHLLKSLSRICNKNTSIFFFHSSDYNLKEALPSDDLEIARERRFGKSSISQLTKKA